MVRLKGEEGWMEGTERGRGQSRESVWKRSNSKNSTGQISLFLHSQGK